MSSDVELLPQLRRSMDLLLNILISTHKRFGTKHHRNYRVYTWKNIEHILEIRSEIDRILGIAPLTVHRPSSSNCVRSCKIQNHHDLAVVREELNHLEDVLIELHRELDSSEYQKRARETVDRFLELRSQMDDYLDIGPRQVDPHRDSTCGTQSRKVAEKQPVT